MRKKTDIELELEAVLKEAISNIDHDRAMAGSVASQVIMAINKSQDTAKYKENGIILAKLVEGLQRSNEQLIKIAALLNKNEEASMELSEEEQDEILDTLTSDNDE